MAPNVEELIKRVNTLTLDKNRLKQRLTQLTNDQVSKDAISRLNQLSQLANQSNTSSLELSTESNNQSSRSNSKILTGALDSGDHSPSDNQLSSNDSAENMRLTPQQHKYFGQLVAGVSCTTASEDDLLFVNRILRNRVDEYNDKWEYLQSKCSALMSELNALQVHYGRLKNEKLDLEEKYKKKSDECDSIKSELQTVVLNYETQLSAMSEHLSAITSRQID